ncbi:hypothetical protein SRHO_G00102950 [Serrasalmus rhombeus]
MRRQLSSHVSALLPKLEQPSLHALPLQPLVECVWCHHQQSLRKVLEDQGEELSYLHSPLFSSENPFLCTLSTGALPDRVWRLRAAEDVINEGSALKPRIQDDA